MSSAKSDILSNSSIIFKMLISLIIQQYRYHLSYYDVFILLRIINIDFKNKVNYQCLVPHRIFQHYISNIDISNYIAIQITPEFLRCVYSA